MIRKLCTGLFMAAALTLSACAPMNPQDAALKQQVISALGDYSHNLEVSASGGRVYLSGWVPTFSERHDVLQRVNSVPGVTEVMDHIRLSEPGSPHDGGNDGGGGHGGGGHGGGGGFR